MTVGDNILTECANLWVKIEDNTDTKSAFIYDIEIFESYRRKGFAKSALADIEKFVADLGVTSIGLYVFNHNSSAKASYESIGYQTVSHNMKKPIQVTSA